jgi:2-polyprenyl-3-methyl-5-hydroxy-6-metoxy-1,4-benzoquinol methylase
MPFTQDHWRSPRKTIANKYQNDDIAYATHGAIVAMECIRRLHAGASISPSMTLLEYGCGTGRIARPLAGYFRTVVGYDPVIECVELARKECAVPQPNLFYTNVSDDLQTASFDVVASINVLEHLVEEDQRRLLDIVKRVAKPKAPILLWYSLRLNRDVLAEVFGKGEWYDDDAATIAERPDFGIQVRLFNNP